MNATDTAAEYLAQGISPEITNEELGDLLAYSEETIGLDLDAVREAMWDQAGTLSAELLHDDWAVIDSTGGVWHPNDDARAEINASNDPATEAVRICREADERGQWHQ